MKRLKTTVIVLSLIASACGGAEDSEETSIDTTTSTSTTTTVASEPDIGEVVDEASLVIPPILLKPLIGATGILTDTSEDWEVVSAIVPLEMGVKIRTGENATAQMSFEDGSALLMGGNAVVNIRSFNYDEDAGARVLTVDVISGSIAYDIFSEGLNASLAKIVTPTAELSVHGTEGVFEYNVQTMSAKSTVLEGGENSDDAVFSELLPDENGKPILVAISQTAGTELGSATTGGSGWVDQESSTVALIVDDFVSNMEGDCSYTCKAETQENLSEGNENLTADNAANAVFTESDANRVDLAQTLLIAAGAPQEITDSVEILGDAIEDIAVSEEVVQEFINEVWQQAPSEGEIQELPPTDFFQNFGDAAQINESEGFQDLGFDHNDQGDFRAQHSMMQFISADTNAVNELAESGDVASALALAASNMFLNAGEDNFVEGTYCFDNPDDADCLAGGPPPEFLAQAFAGNHFVEDMVQEMGFEYSFTENNLKPAYCAEEPWLPECSDGPEFLGNAFEQDGSYCVANPDECAGSEPEEIAALFFGSDDDYCSDNPDSPECDFGNVASVYTFFHVYDEEVLGNDWEPVDCELYPDDPMCTGEGDFFSDFVENVDALALDRDDMFDIYGGPAVVLGPPEEYCNDNAESYECSEDYKAADIYSDGVYVAPGYCEETPDAPECSDEFGNDVGFSGLLTAGMLAQYAAPDPEAFGGEKPEFCSEVPDHPECFRDYYGEESFDTGQFLQSLFSDESYVDLTEQGLYYSTIEGADDLAEDRYGSHSSYLIVNCDETPDEPECEEGYDPAQLSLYAGGDIQDTGPFEYESFNQEDIEEICQQNPNDPICFSENNENGLDIFGGIDCEDAANSLLPQCTNPDLYDDTSNFWGNENNANQFKEQQDTYSEFIGEFCQDNPDDPSCNIGNQIPPGGMPPPDEMPPPGEDEAAQYCDDNPDDPTCNENQESTYTPPPSEGIDCSDPANMAMPQCTNPDMYEDPPGEIESREFCQDNPEDPSCGEDPEPGPAPGSDTDCSLYPDTPECGALPPEGVDVDCSDPANMSLPQCMNSDMYEEPPGEESPPPSNEGEGIDCSDPSNMALPQCMNPDLYEDPPGEESPPPGEESPPPGEESPPPGENMPPPGEESPPPGEESPPPGGP